MTDYNFFCNDTFIEYSVGPLLSGTCVDFYVLEIIQCLKSVEPLPVVLHTE